MTYSPERFGKTELFGVHRSLLVGSSANPRACISHQRAWEGFGGGGSMAKAARKNYLVVSCGQTSLSGERNFVVNPPN